MAYKQKSPIIASEGGTGASSFTAYSVITGGTSSTGALQNVSGVGTSGQVLFSNGSSALPSWQSPSSGARTVSTAYTTAGSGTHNLNASTSAVELFIFGGGGGGGSGRRGTSGASGGGGGGVSGSVLSIILPVSYLGGAGSSVSYTVGAGGAGGASQTTNSTDGNPGNPGSSSIFGNLIVAGGSGGRSGINGNSGTPTPTTGISYGNYAGLTMSSAPGQGANANGTGSAVARVGCSSAGNGGGGGGGNTGTPGTGGVGASILKGDSTSVVAGGAGGIGPIVTGKPA